MKSNFLALMLALIVTATAGADVVYDEADDGDLSGDNLNPTMVTLSDASSNVNSKVIASTTFDPLDRDFFTITIPDGYLLDQIMWGLYDTTEDQSFFAIAAGNTVPSTTNSSLLLGTALIGAGDVANDVLQKLGEANLGGTGFTGPLGPGDYSFWFQENAADVNYGMTFILAPDAVPEPASALLISTLGLACVVRRRR